MELNFINSQKIIRDYLIGRCQETLKILSVCIECDDDDDVDYDLNGELKLPILPNLERLECIGSKIKPRNLIRLLQSSPKLKSLEI